MAVASRKKDRPIMAYMNSRDMPQACCAPIFMAVTPMISAATAASRKIQGRNDIKVLQSARNIRQTGPAADHVQAIFQAPDR
ncbi:hypothetical protein D3C79_1031990 [compost metagenome]